MGLNGTVCFHLLKTYFFQIPYWSWFF